MFGISYVDIDEVSADLQRLKDLNKQLLSELQSASMYDEVRNDQSSGRSKLHYAMVAIQKNREEIRRLERDIEKYRRSVSYVGPISFYGHITEH